MKNLYIVLTLCFLALGGCDDRYRYTCQDPQHFADAQCQKPVCEFTQTCPEYLVAPVLEKKSEGNPAQAPVQQSTASNCR